MCASFFFAVLWGVCTALCLFQRAWVIGRQSTYLNIAATAAIPMSLGGITPMLTGLCACCLLKYYVLYAIGISATGTAVCFDTFRRGVFQEPSGLSDSLSLARPVVHVRYVAGFLLLGVLTLVLGFYYVTLA